ncbi:phage regulatory protein CII [Paraburkholderia unamae]|uniref:phage regulatory CII family protein n=1 Tax=Paraburkholderia unamae TaxID=219649 RepID=UPI000DC558F9|nr:phage regulatory CII family protein [Paraburkholderia unamae]RAR51661.1 phage regulatory protein CII [Paraburkholderia unamae]
MNILDTAHAVAHDYDGGCESLAPHIGMSAAVLRSKVNPNTDTHKLTLQDVIRITEATNDDRVLEAWAQSRGYALNKVPDAEHCSDAAVLELMAKTWETNGEIGKEVNRTFEDGVVERHEVARVKDRIFDHIRTLFGLHSRMEGMVEEKR